MPSDSGRTTSCWMTTPVPDFAPLRENLEADVCVVGAGIAGLTTAWCMLRSGRSVVVLDDGPVAGGETGRSTAHISTAFDDRYTELERLHGVEAARGVAQSHAEAIDFVEALVREQRIECGFARVDGFLFLPPGASTDVLQAEYEAAHRAGLADVERVVRPPLPGFDLGPALRFPQQAQFDPLRYASGLALAVSRAGGRIFCGTRVAAVDDGEPTITRTVDGREVRASAVVVATNSPFVDRIAMHTKQAPYRTYVIGMAVPKGAMPVAQYWDTADPYHYVRIARDLDRRHQLLICGGEDHKTGQANDAEERFERLEVWTRERFPVTGGVVCAWSGQVLEPVDTLAFIGRNPGERNVYIATGDSGNGITHGTIAGQLLTDLVAGNRSPWAGLYDPARTPARALGEFARENLNVARQYGAWATPGDVETAADVAPGCGAIVRSGLLKLAVFRDEQGEVHAFNATCTHLGCVVQWNGTEQSWDCPCHGSRFGTDGRVLNGPAARPLEPAEEALQHVPPG
jgi:glycine/D-amino acid oxidase-like deaminating enzyme/nitrite reductase/ring-hydroxylating ferredoxin subunit